MVQGKVRLDGIIRATNILISGKNFCCCRIWLVRQRCSYESKRDGRKCYCNRSRPLKALEAVMDGFRVMPIKEAALEGDIFLTVTGDKNVIDVEHILTMKDGAFVSNAGHFDVEVNVNGLKKPR